MATSAVPDSPSAAPPAAIRLDGVARRYTVGTTTVTALEQVDLTVDPGSFVVILGPSGSGKSTLLNMIGALDSPTAGEIRIGERRISGASRRQLAAFRRGYVSFIFQTFNLFPGLTALENVEFGLAVTGRRGQRREATEMLERVGLGDRVRHFPHELSGGEQQRVAIARAVASGNPILLADEPTGELDFETGAEIIRLLAEQSEAGRTVLLVTHNREIARVSERVVELSGGRIIADGPPPGGARADIGSLHW